MIENCLIDEENTTVLTTHTANLLKGELSEYKVVVTSIVASLNNVQDLTEKVYLAIGEKLPDINRAFHSAEGEAVYLLDYFRKESGLLVSETGEAQSDLGKLSRAANFLVKVADEQGDAFLKMSEMMKRIDNIKASIESIRDFSAEMEMLSLNAAIVAIKAGDAGRSLNPITAELKKMANSAILLIDEIVENSESLAQTYSLFQEISENQAKSCKADAEETSASLSWKYEHLRASIRGLVEQLNRVINVVKDSGQPIAEIMNNLQIQDILRQCTDHVRLSLEEASAEVGSALNDTSLAGVTAEQVLDSIEFQENVPLLCIQLVDDIDMRLEDSVRELKEGFAMVNSLVQGVTTCESDAGVTVSADADSMHEIDEAFKGVEDVIMQTAVMMQNTANSWEELWSTAVGLEQMLGVLEKQFKQLKKHTNFHQINIPIKIEVARSAGLSKDGELSQRVEGLAEYISTEMKESHKGIIADHQFLSSMVATMGDHKKDIETNLESIAMDVDDLLSNFHRAKEQVKKTFASVCAEMSQLSELVSASVSGLDHINKLIEENRNLRHNLKKLAEMAAKAKMSVRQAANIADWQLHDDRLKGIVDKFTVLAHKRIAEGLYDIDIEDGNQEGDLILF
ncbi:MAG: hypothetical protein ACYC56_08780 [Candidatus Aquicultor sp.]